jgi:hypothetical protein
MIPKTINDKLDKLLLFLYRKTEVLYEEVEIDVGQPAIAYARDKRELCNMLRVLSELGYLEPPKVFGSNSYYLTLLGLERAEQLNKEVINSSQCFVAMWFADDMERTFSNYITKAIVDAGYDPFIISMKEHNDDICDHIIAEIRKSRLLVADFTGQRGDSRGQGKVGWSAAEPFSPLLGDVRLLQAKFQIICVSFLPLH